MRLTNRQKFIAAAAQPLYGGFSTREEVKEAKLLARGHYWHEKEWGQYCSYSPSGRRQYFPYDSAVNSQKLARNEARRWAIYK